MPDDWHAIETLIMTYAERIDLGDFTGVAALFEGATYRAATEEVMEVEGSEAVGAMLDRLVRLYPDGTPRTKHVTTNVIIDIDGNSARSRCYYVVFQQTDDLPLQPIIAGRYHDTFAKENGRWQYRDRLIYADLWGDVSHHLLVDVRAGDGS